MLDNKIAAKKQLFELVAAELSTDGFTARAGDQGFFKKTSFGKTGFHLSFLDRVFGFETILDAAVRFDEVEDIVNQYPLNPVLKDRERKKTFTVGTNFAVAGMPPIWQIEFEEEIPAAARSITNLVREKGMIFLDNNSTLAGVFQTLKDDPARYTRALTVAFLLQDQNSFDQIATEQRILLKDKPDPRYGKFQILENELRNRWSAL